MLRELVLASYFDGVMLMLDKVSDSCVEVLTPFVNLSGDGVSFVVMCDGDSYVVTDEGFSLRDLRTIGLDFIKHDVAVELFQSQLRYFGFSLTSRDEMMKRVSLSELGQAVRDMIQLLISVNSLAMVIRAVDQSDL